MMAEVANTFCYRHPDRATGVSCTRCGRSVCADCMVEAPVGHHCPACVEEGRADMRRVRTVRWRGARGPISGTGWGVKVLVAANVAVFLVELAFPEMKARFAGSGALVANGEVYRLATAPFLHSGVLHLGLNMLALLIAGNEVESAVGTPRLLAGYLLAGLGGSVCSSLVSPDTASVGASGAVFGLFGAWFVLVRSRGLNATPLLVLVGIQLVIGATAPFIDNNAHVGGLLTGVLLATCHIAAGHLRRRLRPAVEVGAAVLVLLALGLLIGWHSDRLGGTFAVPGLDRLLHRPGADRLLVTYAASEALSKVYTVNVDGTARRTVTDGPGFDTNAAWSPDGRRLAFEAAADGNPVGENVEIWSVSADGSGRMRLTDSPGLDLRPAWSPNGTRIAFISNRDGDESIYTAAPDGTGLSRLPGAGSAVACLAWSPDGGRIAFARSRPAESGLFTIRADGTGLTRLSDATSCPGWSPDGRLIGVVRSRVFQNSGMLAQEDDVLAVRADGSGTRRLARVPRFGRDLVLVARRWSSGPQRPGGHGLHRVHDAPGRRPPTAGGERWLPPRHGGLAAENRVARRPPVQFALCASPWHCFAM